MCIVRPLGNHNRSSVEPLRGIASKFSYHVGVQCRTDARPCGNSLSYHVFISLKLKEFKMSQIHILIDKLTLYSPIGNSTTYFTSEYEIWIFTKDRKGVFQSLK